MKPPRPLLWSLPMYEQLLADVRSVNEGLPPAKRLRVIAGDLERRRVNRRGKAGAERPFAWSVRDRQDATAVRFLSAVTAPAVGKRLTALER